MSLCGCRLWPIDASIIERRVYDEAARAAPMLAAGDDEERPGDTLARLYTRIEVGGTPDDITFVPHE